MKLPNDLSDGYDFEAQATGNFPAIMLLYISSNETDMVI